MKILYQSKYIELLKRNLIDYTSIGTLEYHPLPSLNKSWKVSLLRGIDALLRKRNFTICKMQLVEEEMRINGYDYPARAVTMVGMNRLNNIQDCISKILEDNVPGDVIEAGVWRGGAVIFMKALLDEAGAKDRRVFVADSFNGLPEPTNVSTEANRKHNLYRMRNLAVSEAEVKRNFENFDLLDDQVVFLKGWFKDSLPKAGIEKLAFIRLDADLFESTTDAIEQLYPKLSSGGFIVIDDYNAFPFCKAAIDRYREKHRITEEIIPIDQEAVFWRKN